MSDATILIADDDAVSARFLTRLLTREGHQVHIVETAEAALAACSATPPDLVLIDLVAPRGQGFDVCRGTQSSAANPAHSRCDCDRSVRPPGPAEGHRSRMRRLHHQALRRHELRARVHSLVRLKRYTDELETAETIMLGLGATIEARDRCTRGHCQRLAWYATTLGRALSLDEADLGARTA